MTPKSGRRFSEKIMLQGKVSAGRLCAACLLAATVCTRAKRAEAMGVARRGDHLAAACRSLDCLDGDRTDAAKKHLLAGTGQPLDRLVERQPLDCLHIRHQTAGGTADGPHGPELHDLYSLADVVSDRAQKRVHISLVAALFQHLAPGRGERAFVVVDLSLRQYPVVVFPQLHDRDQRFTAAAQHHPTSCEYW